MQTKSNRRGFALGAVVALLASLFGAAPASYATTDGAHIDIRPLSNAATTNFGGLLEEDFPIYAQLKSGTTNAAFSAGNLTWKITHVSGATGVFAVASTWSATVGASNTGFGTYAAASTSQDITEYMTGITATFTDGNSSVSNVASFSHTTSLGAKATSVTLSAKVNSTNGIAPLFLAPASLSAFTTTSPNSVFDVTIFIDDFGGQNGDLDAGNEWFTTQRITLYATGNLAPTLSVGSPVASDEVATVSATLNSVNWSNLNGKTFVQVSTGSAAVTTISSAITGAQASARAGVVTSSIDVSPLTGGTRLWVSMMYANGVPAAGDGSSLSTGRFIGSSLSAVVTGNPVDTLSVSATANANITGGGTAYTVRPNQTYTINVFAGTSSNTVSVSTTVTVDFSGPTLVTSSKLISINGGAFLTAYPADGISVTTGTSGQGSFTLATSGFVAGDILTVSASVGNESADSVDFLVAAPAYTVVIDDALVASAPGTAVNVAATVEDQWEELSSATNQYLKLTRAIASGSFNFAPTVSYHAVTAGAANVAFTPQGAAATGSVTLTFDIVKLENGAYIANGTADTLTVTVTGAANDFGTGLLPTHSATVSYFPSTVSWTTITGKVDVTGSAVVITGDNVVFRKSAAVPATSSGTLTVASDASAGYSFQVAPLTTGDKTLTLKNGSATTTSLLVVSDAYSDYGYAISWDTTEIVAGKTRIITGTLTDQNGNGVDTTNAGSGAGDSGTASIVVTYTGTAGIVVGTMPTETDADGKFRISVLTSAADEGTLTFTAVYMPQGSSTVAANKLTSVNLVTVGEASAATAEQKVNAGSFKGYVAVYAKGYEGQRLSAKVGNDWVVVPALASNFVRVVEFTGAGYTIAVRIYIDRVLVDTITVTTK